MKKYPDIYLAYVFLLAIAFFFGTLVFHTVTSQQETRRPVAMQPAIVVVNDEVESEIKASTTPEVAVKPAEAKPTPKKVAEQPAPPAPSQAAMPPEISIRAKAIVGLYCHGDDPNELWKGSGTIINPQGYILTNRHVAKDALYCEVAMPSDYFLLPTRDQIRETNFFPALDNFRPYKATAYYLPELFDMSEDEAQYIDFAIMKIIGPSDACQLYASCDIPKVFPYNPVSIYTPISPLEVISYGYPAEGPAASAEIFAMKGSIGNVIKYFPGDKKWLGQDFVMLRQTVWGTFFGASGSGVFFNGHVIGTLYANFEFDRTYDLVLPMKIIHDVLKEKGLGWILSL